MKFSLKKYPPNSSAHLLVSRKSIHQNNVLKLLIVIGLAIGMVGFISSILNQSTELRRQASTGQITNRELLSDIENSEADDEQLQSIVSSENEYRERVASQAELRRFLLSDEKIDASQPAVQKYSKAFSVDMNLIDPKVLEQTRNSIKQDPNIVSLTPTDTLTDSNSDLQSSGQNRWFWQANAQGSGQSSLPQVGYKNLPTIEGFNVEKFTGTSTVSYPIEIPTIRGSIGYSLDLSYQSRRIDELRLNKLDRSSLDPEWDHPTYGDNWEQTAWPDKNIEQTMGLGWQLSGLQKIVIDPQNRNEALISWGGQNLRIRYIQSENRYYTVPESQLKITRMSDGRWRVIDQGGTNYIFGSPNGDHDSATNPSGIPRDSFNEYGFGARSSYDPENPDTTPDTYCYLEKTGWILSKIIDLQGNSLEFSLEQDVASEQVNVYNYGQSCTMYRTANYRLNDVYYNWNEQEQKYMTDVKFAYSNYKFRDNLQDHAIKRLDSIRIINDGLLVSQYDLSYTESLPNPLWNGLKNYLLLTGITKKGFDGQLAEKPYTFCYNSLTSTNETTVCDGSDVSEQRASQLLSTNQLKRTYTPNTLYLVKANNGYGGTLEYRYENVVQIPRICTNHKDKDSENRSRFCTDEITDLRAFTNDASYEGFTGNIVRQNETSFWRVSTIIANNDDSNQLGDAAKLKVTKYEYVGQPEAYAKDFEKGDWHGRKYLTFNGLQFLGYDTVRIKTYEPESYDDINTIKSFGSYVEEKTVRSVTRGSSTNQHGSPDSQSTTCVMIDPRKGNVYQSKIMNQDGSRVIGENKTNLAVGIAYTPNFEWITSEGHLAQKCYPNAEYWPSFKVLTRESYSSLDGRETKSQTFYDYDFDPRITHSFGNPVKQVDMGDVSKSHDDIYNYKIYMNSEINQNNWSDYEKKNLTGLLVKSFSSNRNARSFTEIDNIPDIERYSYTEYEYDKRLQEWQSQNGILGPRGLLSDKMSLAHGTSFYEMNKPILLKTQLEYDQYGNMVAATTPSAVNEKGLASITYFDDRYHLFPVCRIQARNKGAVLDYKSDWQSACSSGEDRTVTLMEYAANPTSSSSWKEGLARGLAYRIIDQNNAVTRFEFDGFGRVIKVFEPDANNPNITRDLPSQLATYYDDLVPLRSRVEQNKVIVDSDGKTKEVKKTVDSIIDGFGNQIENTVFSNYYDKNEGDSQTTTPYATFSKIEFNGVGQVVKKIEGVKLDNLEQPPIPSLLDPSVLIDEVMAAAADTTTKYDILNRPTEITARSADVFTRQLLSYNGYTTRSVDTRGTTSEIEISPRGQTLFVKTYVCVSQSVCNATTPGSKSTTTRYNYHPVLQKPTQVIDTYGVVVRSTVYNTSGMPVRLGNRDRGPTFNYYDDTARLIKTEDSAGRSIESEYDDLDRVVLLRVKDSAGEVKRVEELEYDTDKIGQLYARRLKDYSISPDQYLQTISMKKNYAGWVTETNQKTLDLLNPAVVDGNTTSYVEIVKQSSYTVTGMMTEATTKVKNPQINDGKESLLDQVRYRYNDDGKLLQSIDAQTQNNLVSLVSYTKDSQPAKILFGNGVLENYSYDGAQRTISKSVVDQQGVALSGVAYEYERRNGFDSGLITTIKSSSNPAHNNHFSYDSFGRLIGTMNDGEDNTEYTARYVFDIVGNLQLKEEKTLDNSVSSSATSYFITADVLANPQGTNVCTIGDYASIYGYDESKHGCPYHGVKYADVNDELEYYLYTKTGALTEQRNKGGEVIKQYKYGVLDMPLEYWDAKDGELRRKAQYFYGLGGQRIAQLTPEETTKARLYLGDYEVKKQSVLDNPELTEVKYVESGMGKIIKERTNAGPWKTSYYHLNHQGSTVALTGDDGRLTTDFATGPMRYFPYGSQITNLSTSTLPVTDTYTGQKMDSESNLMFYNARLYNPELGVFLQADAVEDGLNSFMYVGGNPVNSVDPTGNTSCPEPDECMVPGKKNRVSPYMRAAMPRVIGPVVTRTSILNTNQKVQNGIEQYRNPVAIEQYLPEGHGARYMVDDFIDRFMSPDDPIINDETDDVVVAQLWFQYLDMLLNPDLSIKNPNSDALIFTHNNNSVLAGSVFTNRFTSGAYTESDILHFSTYVLRNVFNLNAKHTSHPEYGDRVVVFSNTNTGSLVFDISEANVVSDRLTNFILNIEAVGTDLRLTPLQNFPTAVFGIPSDYMYINPMGYYEQDASGNFILNPNQRLYNRPVTESDLWEYQEWKDMAASIRG